MAQNTDITVSPEAKKLHFDSIVADLHADSFLLESLFGYNIAKRHRSIIPRNPLFNHLDIPRAEEGGLNITGQGIVVLAQKPRKDNFLQCGDRMTRRILRGIEGNADKLALVLNAKEARAAVKNNKIGVFMGIEGAHILSGKLEAVEYFHSLGVRYLTLGHFSENEAVYSSNDLKNAHENLKPFGKRLIKELEAYRIMVDITHVAPGCFWDIMKLVTHPVIASHTGIKAVHSHWRNLDDEQLKAVAATGGVVGIMFQPGFLSGNTWRCSLDTVIAHIEHAIKVAGEDHVALGSDFDGFITTPDGLEDVTCLPNITQSLLERGYSKKVIRKFLGENFLRVFAEVCDTE